jgi:hypothetical protein
MATKKSSAPLVVPLAVAAGAGALLLSRKAKADPGVKPKKKKKKKKKGGKKKDITPKKDDVRPKAYPSIGAPYRPGKANEGHNAVLVCKRQPLRHPRGLKRRGGQRLDDWYTNVAFWETYPKAPTKLSAKDPAQKAYRHAWMRLRGKVRKCLTTPKKKGGGEKIKPTTPKEGTKFPDRVAEIRNSQAVVDHRPTSFPRNPSPHNKRGSGQTEADWLANVAYWTTYPDAPVRITPAKEHRKFVTVWKRIHGLVSVNLLHANKKEDSKKGGVTPKDPGPTMDEPPIGKPPAGSQAGATEMRNAAIVAVDAPTTYPKNAAPYNVWKGSNKNQKLNDWLANVAYWATYPTGPVVLKKSDTKYVQAWLRIRKYIDQAQAAAKGAKGKPPIPVPENAWKKFAAAMALSSDVRSSAAVAKHAKAGFGYLSNRGKPIAKRDINDPLPGGGMVMPSGLTAASAVYSKAGRLSDLAKWRPKPPRAFWVANGLF